MAIIKLGELSFIKRGSSPRPINQWLQKDGLMWAKISDLNGNFLNKTKEFINPIWEKKGLIGKYGDLLITNSATPGIPFIQLTKKVAYHDGFLAINCNENLILKKYLFYKLIIDRPKLIKMGNGAVFINLSSDILKNWNVYIPNISIQQQIIDIIEPNEKLFLKYSNCVRIDSFENVQNDMKDLIDIIEPIELIETKLAKIKNKLIKLLIDLYSTNVKIQNSFNSRIKILNSSYEGQNNYFATNAIGELEIDYNKIIPLTGKIPSRANISPTNDSFIFSKLDGENKLFYFKERPKEVFSTGFFNFKTEYHDHILGFMLSDKFKLQKEQYATGTTMRSINNQSLKLIQLNEPKYKSNNITIMLYDIEKTSNKSKELKSKLINLLIK
ncbi:restriction endonuclease subunit S [Spiroplasma platyhelix]|uniref:restriction endonuclease subunit S n=1 Tax=Spiroplasma platyhelix TaxID=301585 RepID=UPI001F360553|nr:restriction endonuclease subunit S [Spiroplasma platyhelix]UJB28792.1 type I restriction enzyme, S subunit [Spiroplasma platyhelix PALS-1]